MQAKKFKVIKNDAPPKKHKQAYTFAQMLCDWEDCNNNMGFWQRDDWLGQQKFLTISISPRPYCVLYQTDPHCNYISYDEHGNLQIDKPQNKPIDDSFTINDIKALDTMPYVINNEDIFEHQWYCFKRLHD